MQSDLFELLIKRTDIVLDSYPNARVFLEESEYESLRADVIPKATLRFGRNQIASIYEYQNVCYLVVPNIFENISSESLKLIKDIKEIGFVYIVDNSIYPNDKASRLELEENIFVDENVTDIEWSQITPYFPGYSIFQIVDTTPTTSENLQVYLKQLCIALLCQTSEQLELPYESQTLDAFMAIANSTDNNIPFDNILRSLTSYQWKFCFIDLYRCQERLLLLAWVEEFRNSISSSLPLKNLHAKMKDRKPPILRIALS